ncbi:MAG: hypothetical protein HYV04_18835 [Deltaproteobacteria bacterium]|nr:hypothetical protein [Deltaproteobacteria bacterium]
MKPRGGNSKLGYIIIAFLMSVPTALLWWHLVKPQWLPQPPKNQPSWREPDGFMDIKFGHNLTEQIPKCAEEWYRDQKLCWTGFDIMHDYYEIQNTRLGNTVAIQLENKLEHISISFSSDRFPEILATFIERYGKPTNTATKPWRSKGGAEFTNATAAWLGERVSIFMEERDAKVDQGSVSYSTAVWLAHSEKERKERIKEQAARL